ncbi:hypothetical protein F3Y22_tig00000132pilonHSYRG00090 [Hibiscus syriacus]|uniref:Glycerol-3-phosphate O-acyltransferase alpha-helical bundle N-terminal domain-containing protein n=1 Tax=Hibiscus syriacus TaxID=106335 RepID=A0A6A3D3H7_HIBSY|nr:hypothetical protein F3Y22_tig00000132pilonHSYRG00090 [Hibiscus syriacus]
MLSKSKSLGSTDVSSAQVFQSGDPAVAEVVLSNMAVALDRVLLDVEGMDSSMTSMGDDNIGFGGWSTSMGLPQWVHVGGALSRASSWWISTIC